MTGSAPESHDVNEYHIEVPRTARIVSSGPLRTPADEIWIVLHGYAQLAREFLAQFEPVRRPDRLFVAPEGLSRFYRKRGRGSVGASWMTSEDRDQEIRDYLVYLDAVLDLVLSEQGRRPETLGVLGFSQGSSTSSRWVASMEGSPRAVDRLVLWGGTPAAELRTSDFQDRIAPCRVDWVTGSTDRFTPPEKLSDLLPAMDSRSNPIRFTQFDGGHELPADALGRVLDAGLELSSD